jgi:hypothetical protein
MATCSGIAGAQESLSNFEACVAEGKQRHTDAAMENYLSYKCDGAAAQRLAARPDQCVADVKPSLRNVERRSRQLNDGLYQRIIWRTDACAGMCETRFYTDARDTSYLCEVRRHLEARIPQNGPQPLRNTGYYRRYVEDYPPPPRYTYGPAARTYEQPRYYVVRPRTAERWYYIEPGRYVEYRYPGDYADDDRREDYRRDDYRTDGYRGDDYRRDDYRRSDDRADDDRGDGYRRYEYR